MPKCSNPSGSGTCILTPEIACAIAEEWAEGKSFAKIVSSLRQEGHTLNNPDITWWLIDNREVEIAGQTYRFRELLESIYPHRVFDLLNEAIEIVDKAAKDKTSPWHAKNQMNVRMHAISAMTPKHVLLPADMGRVIVPENSGIFEDDASPVN